MKRNIKWIAVLIFLVGIISQSACLTYVNESEHYSITLGNEWEFMDESVLRFYETVYAETGEIIPYSAGFKLIDNDDFEFPIILIQEDNRRSFSMKDVESALKTGDIGTDLLTEDPGLRDFNSYISHSQPFVDKEKGIILITMSLDGTITENASALIGMVFGKKSIVVVNCYALESDFEKDYKKFVGIVESCSFEPNYQYTGLTKAITESGALREGSTGDRIVNVFFKYLTYVLAGLIVFGLPKVFRKKPKRKLKPYGYGGVDYDKISIESLGHRLMSITDINRTYNFGLTAIMIASARTSNIDKIRMLIEKGANVNRLSHDGMTPFIFASCFNENLEIVKLIRSHVEDIDHKESTGRTALSCAAEGNKNTEVVAYLIAEGADVNSMDNNQRTPLIWACAIGENEDNIMLLIDKGAELDIIDSFGYTAYKYIKRNKKLKHSSARQFLEGNTGVRR